MNDKDRQWLEDLWLRHGGQVFAYAARRVGAQRADDVVADVFLVAWRRRQQRPRRELPWLYGVARRVLADHYRGEYRQARLIERAGHASQQQPLLEDDVAGTMQLATVLAELSDLDREALLLTAWEGLRPSEAAAALDMAAPAFRMRLTRARRRFRSAMAAASALDVGLDTVEEGGSHGR